MRSPSSKT